MSIKIEGNKITGTSKFILSPDIEAQTIKITHITDRITQDLLNLSESVQRQALMDLGWTPPKAEVFAVAILHNGVETVYELYRNRQDAENWIKSLPDLCVGEYKIVTRILL